jgi:hypothetical protein
LTGVQVLIVAGVVLYLVFDWIWTRRSGGSRRAQFISLSLNVIAFGIVVAVPFPLGWIIAVAICAAVIVLRERWIDWFRARRPAAGLFAAYRRLFRAAEEEWALPPGLARDRAHIESVEALERLNDWRSPETVRLISLLGQYYHSREEGDSSPELPSLTADLNDEMIRVWGTPTNS